MFKTVRAEVSAEITEKKSKFICNIFHVESVKEAEEYLNKIRKEYHDARHNCYAYKIFDENIFKSSDDGEPSGTAGIPILNILNGKDLSNILVVVTRYFGGILLGTGGLVRAYSSATTEALNKADIVNEILGVEAEFLINYNELEEVKYQMKNRNINILNLEYNEKIKVMVEGKEEDIIKIKNEKLSDRIDLENVNIIKKKYIIVN